MPLLTGRSHDSSYFSQVAVLSELLQLSLTYGEEGKVGQSGDKYNDEAGDVYRRCPGKSFCIRLSVNSRWLRHHTRNSILR